MLQLSNEVIFVLGWDIKIVWQGKKAYLGPISLLKSKIITQRNIWQSPALLGKGLKERQLKEQQGIRSTRYDRVISKQTETWISIERTGTEIWARGISFDIVRSIEWPLTNNIGSVELCELNSVYYLLRNARYDRVVAEENEHGITFERTGTENRALVISFTLVW